MGIEMERSDLPAKIADALVSIPKGLTPGVIKALDRLLGAAVDIPVAWLAQKKAKIDAQTESYKLVETAIAQAVATDAGADEEIAQRAMNVLVRKEYRKQINREAVATAMVEDLREQAASAETSDQTLPPSGLDEDWLNVFERYAEDASSERLQGLWGRVLAGELRRPGRFSTRTLRFLSEFSQADALNFEIFSKSAFGDIAPKRLIIPNDEADIGPLIFMEANGLIQGATGLGLFRSASYNESGYFALSEGDLRLVFKGNPGERLSLEVIVLTPLGQELLSLVGSRDPRESARAVASSFKNESIREAFIGVRTRPSGRIQSMEVLWLDKNPPVPVVEGSVN